MDEKDRQRYEAERESYFQRLKLTLISAISTGEFDSILREFAEEYAEIKVERDDLAIKIHQLIAQITWHVENSFGEYYTSKNRRAAISEQLNEIADKASLPYPAVIWVNVTKELDQIFLEGANSLEKTPKSQHEDVRIDAMPDLNRIVGRTKLSTWWEARNIVTSLAIGHSDDPKMICYQIVRELRDGGGAKIETVERLSSEWIRAILGRSVKPEKLHNAITHAHQFRIEKNRKDRAPLSQGQYIARHPSIGSESNLRLYVAYLEAIEKKATDIPSLIKSSIDAMFNK